VLILVAYDVNTENRAGQRRLRRVARVCENHGQRVQFSVFECLVDAAQWVKLKAQLVKEIDEEHDSLRFYYLGNNWQNRVEHVGAKPSYDPEGPLVIQFRSVRPVAERGRGAHMGMPGGSRFG